MTPRVTDSDEALMPRHFRLGPIKMSFIRVTPSIINANAEAKTNGTSAIFGKANRIAMKLVRNMMSQTLNRKLNQPGFLSFPNSSRLPLTVSPRCFGTGSDLSSQNENTRCAHALNLRPQKTQGSHSFRAMEPNPSAKTNTSPSSDRKY